jgi:hypothetical protein
VFTVSIFLLTSAFAGAGETLLARRMGLAARGRYTTPH